MKNIRVGIVGLGTGRTAHLPRLLQTPGITVVGVTDVCEKKRKETAYLYDLKDYLNYRELCECEDIDVVFILTPPSSHLEISEAACENHKHIFCEKPMALNADEGETMVRKASKAGVVLMIGYMMRFSPEIVLLKDMLPLLGDEVKAETARTLSLPPRNATFHYDRRLGGGALFETGIHHLNLLRSFFGKARPVDVNMKMRGDVDVETSYSLKFANGVTTHSVISWADPVERNSIHVEGKKGYVKVLYPTPRVRERFVHFNLENILRQAGDLSICIRDSKDPFTREFEHLVDCILTDQQPLTPGSEAVEDLRLVSEIYSLGESK
jgi:glucose-fructose oxidoreductase